MNKDLIKTGGAILLIAIIVVATFLYGNNQRQEQVRKDQAAKQADKDMAAMTPTTPSNNSGAASATPAQSTASTPASTPSTGGELGYLLPAGAILVAYQASRRSQKSLELAIRNRA